MNKLNINNLGFIIIAAYIIIVICVIGIAIFSIFT